MNKIKKRSYTVTEEQETLENIIKLHYGDIPRIEDIMIYLEQFNLILSYELYKGDTIFLPNLPKHLIGEEPAYLKHICQKDDCLESIIKKYYEKEVIDIAKTKQYIKKINNIENEPQEFDTILLPVNLPSFILCNNIGKNTINFMECFNQVISNEEFEEI